MTADLLIGPVLRRVTGDRATLWMETSEPASVRVDAATGGSGTAKTFSAYGHHYAIVIVDGLAIGADNPYEVRLDERVVWPAEDSAYPKPLIRTRPLEDREAPVSLIFGSCRQAAADAHLPPDALDAYARRLMTDAAYPDLMVLLGDQVYADEASASVKRALKRRRAKNDHRPVDQVVSFDEYTKLYFESWRDPEVRWLLATVPSVMIFDDHEIIDDWNTSQSWREDIRREPWWAERISAGLASYWVYQHLGNLSPDDLAADPLYQKVTTTDDATELLREFGSAVDDGTRIYQWSYALDIGGTRLAVLDNRCSRVLTPGLREMLPATEWSWFLDQAHGSYDHLVVGCSLPWLMPPGIHHLEAWNERTADSPSPRVAARAEKLRRAFDLEHWAAFKRSFDAMGELFRRLGQGSSGERVGAGEAYAAPASISVLGGDVHHSYVAQAHFGTPMTTPVYQLTCSPVHNQVPAFMRPLMRFSWSRVAARFMRGVAKSAGVQKPAWTWSRLAGPYFGNAISTLRLTGRQGFVRVEGTGKDGELFEVARVDYPG